MNARPIVRERSPAAVDLHVNNASCATFKGLGHTDPYGDTTVKRIATTLLVASLLTTPMLMLPPAADAAVSVGISVNIAPPPLPVYAQPVVPGPGYIWTPGYWGWDPAYGYYWVPGTWVMPPEIGLLWTPGWWGWSEGYYRWHAGYWGPRVGFYGGINYGYGYFGSGYVGGQWRGRQFYYNRAVNHINAASIHDVYINRTVINNAHVNRVSYNGGRGGLRAQPTAAQRAYAGQRRIGPTSMQSRQREAAMRDPAQRFQTNRGNPAVFATQHAARFSGPHVVHAPEVRQHDMARPENRNVHMVQAPHDRATMSQREYPTARPQSEMPQEQRRQPQTWRGQSPRPDMVRMQPMPRNEHGAPRQEPQARGKGGENRPPKSSGGH
jgi:WXXGXW repeat (2 copies)